MHVGRKIHPGIAEAREHVLSGVRARLEDTGSVFTQGVATFTEYIPAWLDTRWGYRRSIGSLQKEVRYLDARGPVKGKPGIFYPEGIEAFVAGQPIRLKQVGGLAVAVADLEIGIFVVDWGADSRPAVEIGSIPVTQDKLSDHFNNTSPNLGYNLSREVSRYVLANYVHCATFDEFHD